MAKLKMNREKVGSAALNQEISDKKTPINRDDIDPEYFENIVDIENGIHTKPQPTQAKSEVENSHQVNESQGLEISLRSGKKTRAKLVKVNPNDISIDFEGNKRNISEKKVRSLVPLIIESNGNSEPYYIRIHPDKDSGIKYQAITGKRRTLASRIAKTEAYCMLIEASYEDAVVLASHENEGREPFTVFERADQIQELIDVIGNKSQAIQVFNSQSGTKKISRTHAYDIVLPAKVPIEFRKIIDDSGEITIPQIKKLLKQIERLNEELDIHERNKFIASIGAEIPVLSLVSLIKDKIAKVKGVNVDDEDIKPNEKKQILNKKGKSIGTFDSKSGVLKLNKNASDEFIEEIINLVSSKASETE